MVGEHLVEWVGPTMKKLRSDEIAYSHEITSKSISKQKSLANELSFISDEVLEISHKARLTKR